MYFPSGRCVFAAVAFAFCAAASSSHALITSSTYPASTATGVALESMSSGTTQLVAPDSDDDPSEVTPIGFDFWYDGVRYAQFSVNPNGVCRLGSDAISDSYDNSVDFAAVTNAPKICPYFDDLIVGTNGKIHYKVIGAAPNRTLVIEWSNMQVPYVAPGNTGAATFQLKLSESTGIISFIYGTGMVVNTESDGYSVGLQSGAATNFASVTTQSNATSYSTASTTQTNAITSGRSYTFTPPTPTAPTNLTFTNVTGSSMQLNWNENANNELGYVIYESTDGTNFTFFAQTAAGSNNYTATGLTPSTTYHWRVYAVTSGKLSTALTGSRATNPIGNITSVSAPAQVRNWSSTSTWVGGVVPSSTDNVTIAADREVVIDTNANALSLTVSSGSILRYEPTNARTLTVGQSVSIAANGTFTTSLNQASTQTGHVLSIGANLTNNGTLDFSTYPMANGNSAAARIVFTGANDATFSGPGQKTDLREIELNKDLFSVLTMNFSGPFTVQGANSAGFLTLTNGTLRIAGTGATTNPVFKTAPYMIPPNTGIWLDNPNFVVAATASGDMTVNGGLLRVSQGTYNIGLTGADAMGGDDNAGFVIEGGSLNVAGSFAPQGAVSYSQSGGTVNVATVGNTREDFGSFEIYSPSSLFEMSGGAIVLHKRNSSAFPVDYRVQSSTVDVTNDGNPTLFIGAADTPASTSFQVVGAAPNIQIHANAAVTAIGPLVMSGATVLNNGSLAANSGGSFAFAGLSPMTYGGTGTFGTQAVPFGGTGVSCLGPDFVTLNAPIFTTRVNLVQGGFINSNQLRILTSGASTATVQVGGGGPDFVGGSFDVSPTFNPADQPIVNYLSEALPRTTGLEIPPSRSLSSLTINNSNNVTISGGNLTLTAAGGVALNLASGRLITGSNTVSIANGNGTTVRTANGGWVDGNLQKKYTVNTSKTFEVGTANAYSRVSIGVTAGSLPQSVTVRANQGQHPAYPPGYPSYPAGLQRYWTITDPGNLTTNLNFFYSQADVVGIEDNYKIAKYSAGMFSTPTPQNLDPFQNGVSATMQTAISGDWTVFESDSDFDGLPDSYELSKTGGQSATSFTPDGDLDGDGQSNLRESFAGTDPQVSSSALRITSITRSPGGPATINFQAIASKRYRLESKSALTNASWQNAGVADLVPAMTGIAQLSDFSPTPPRKYYRVSLITP